MPAFYLFNVTGSKQAPVKCKPASIVVGNCVTNGKLWATGLMIVFLFSAACLRAQTKKADSLQNVLKQHPVPDTFRVNRYVDLANEWNLPEPQRIVWAVKALRLSTQLHYPRGKAEGLATLAMIKYYHSQYDRARVLLLKALPYAKEGKDLKQLSQLYQFLAYATNDKKQQQEYFQQSIELAKQLKDNVLLASVYQGVAWFARGEEQQRYYRQAIDAARQADDPVLIINIFTESARKSYFDGDYPNAIQASMQAMQTVDGITTGSRDSLKAELLQVMSWTYTQLKDYDRALAYLNQIQKLNSNLHDGTRKGSTFSQLGDTYREKGEWHKALQMYRQGLKDTVQLKGTSWLVAMEANSAVCWQQLGNYQKAMLHARRALGLIKQMENKFLASLTYRAMGQNHLHFGNLDSSLYYGHESIRNALEFRDKPSLRDAGLLLAQTYAQKKDFEKAYEFQRKYTFYKDSLNNEVVSRKATVNEFALQLQKQEEEAHLQRIQIYSGLAVLALVLGLTIVLLINNRQKQRANTQLKAQKDEIKVQRDQIEQTLTKLRNTQAQLIQKEKMASLGELTAGIAHEIQNPLNFVNNFSELSVELAQELKEELRKAALKESEQEYVEELIGDLSQNQQKINHHGKRASAIVKGMLEHSRAATGERQPTDLNALVEEYLRLAYHGLRAKDKDRATDRFQADFELIADPNLPLVNVIPQEIGRVLLNVLNNAFYAVGERAKKEGETYRPTVKVSTSHTPEEVVIKVEDNGSGMSEEILSRIFQPFFTTKPPGEGTGLGLSLSYDIITGGHSGTLEAESELKKGTRMLITLPI